MKTLIQSIQEKLVFNKHTKEKYHYHPKSKDELLELIDKLINERGDNANLNDIDTSKITDMSYLFYYSKFNGNISDWDVSNVKSMQEMFYKSQFNGDLSKWDISNVKDMTWIFRQSPLENNPPKWYKE